MASRAQITASVWPQSRLSLVRQADQPTLRVEPGLNQVVAIARRTPRRFFTYDTGKDETVFIELDPAVDLTRQDVRLISWIRIGFKFSSMRVIYLSMTATGEVILTPFIRKPLFGAPRHLLHGTVRLGFTHPLLDHLQSGSMSIDWKF